MRTVREIARQSGAGKYQGICGCPDSRPSLRGACPRLPDVRRQLYGVILIVSLMLPLTTELPLLSSHNPDQSEAIRRLSKVFGIDRVPLHFRHRAPPQFMTELYRRVTDSGGLSKTYTPYRADTVRSLPDKNAFKPMQYYYNLSRLTTDEKILEAELRLFKLKPKPPEPGENKPPHVIEIRVFQIIDPAKPGSSVLLEVRKSSTHFHGWMVFNVTRATRSWVNGTKRNYGFLITATSLKGAHVNGSFVRFAQHHEHHESKQPVLIVYTDDGMPRNPNFITPSDENYKQIKNDILRQERKRLHRSKNFQHAVRLLNEKDRFQSDSYRKPSRHRSYNGNKNQNRTMRYRRASDYHRYRRHRKLCTRNDMYVDFEDIGWSSWIISPKGYNAYHCTGECPFPLGQSQKPTNHATVQSIVHALRVGKDVSTPCCVPNKLYSISLLYFDDDENVILKQYDDMVAASCGCH